MKHWLKIASVEWSFVEAVAREDVKHTTKICRPIVSGARSTGAHQAIEVSEKLDATDNSELMPRVILDELKEPVKAFRNVYTFRLLEEWSGAAAFSICRAKVPSADPTAGTEEQRREESLVKCLVVWTEAGMKEAAGWWLSRIFRESHMPAGVEGPVQQFAKAASSAPDPIQPETKAKAFSAALTAWLSERHVAVNSAALPLASIPNRRTANDTFCFRRNEV